MTSPGSGDGRTLASLIALGIACHSVLGGSRVVVSLAALAQHASAFTVGALLALYALLPMLLAVAVGRLVDRKGMLLPMRLGCVGLAIGALLPAVLPWTPILFVSAAILGISFMSYQVAAQKGTGALGGPADRSRNFSMLAMGYSVSGFIGPLIAGFAIDQWGFRVAFGVLAALPVIPAVMLSTGQIRLPHPERAAAGRLAPGGVRIILREPILRRVLLINVLFAMGWDLHTIFVPIFGAKIGLSASEIGAVLSTFAAATFVVRLAMPTLMRYRSEQQVLVGALVVAGAVYVVYPLAASALAMAALSFVLGLGLGSGQPMVMSLLHNNSPAGRVGEAVGLRMALVQASSVFVPLAFGALGTTLGLAPVFIAVGIGIAGGGLLARQR